MRYNDRPIEEQLTISNAYTFEMECLRNGWDDTNPLLAILKTYKDGAELITALNDAVEAAFN